ncbi:MAG: hypothetical protein AB7G75_00510 [Candidatus Binatia bacterium]
MVGVPGTEERIALADIEDRLRHVRSRFNLYSCQKNLYTLGAILAVGAALLIICAFSLSPLTFTLLSWPILLLLAFLFVYFLRRNLLDWTDVNEAAQRIDAKAGLKDRLSTLIAQLTAGVIGKPAPSRLWSHLLRENTDLLSDWTVKKVAPRRIPWHIFPFLLALLLLFLIAVVPMISTQSATNPFSLSNLQTVLSELPQRAGEVVDKKLSLLPNPPDQWGKSSLYNQDSSTEFTVANDDTQQINPDESPPETRSLASLPEALQEKIRQALQGLPDKNPPPDQDNADPSGKRRLALKPSDTTKKPNATIEASNLPPQLNQQRDGAGRGQEQKDGSPSGASQFAQGLAQGSGIQQLEHARLDRKNARGAFQPDPNSPQMPGRGGESGEGGQGAGSGTDPRLYGEQPVLDDGTNTFQLALETTHERSYEEGAETDEKYEGGIIEKSTRTLSQQQSLDDAIRKSRVPPEYEEIVKRVFSRGEPR